MNKFIKPIAFLFIVALSSSAMAQQGKPAKKLKVHAGARDVKAKELVDPRVNIRAMTKGNVKQLKLDVIRKKGVKSVAVK